jgi:hypothetical protein
MLIAVILSLSVSSANDTVMCPMASPKGNIGCPSEELDLAGTSNSMNVRLTEAEIHAVSTACRSDCGFLQIK